MGTRTIIETHGSISKQERLGTVEHHVLQNSFVLETLEPYPGYHGANLPTGSSPISIFLITSKKYSAEKIIRITQNIKRYFKPYFDATAGKICIYNDTYSCIRVKDLNSYEIIPDLQSCFQDEGIKFMKKKFVEGAGIIQVKKHFVIEKVVDGIYKDLDVPLIYYLHISTQLNWNPFKEITLSIKNNIKNNNFDAALGAIYLQIPLDVVRIYVKGMKIEDLQLLREKYNEEIQNYSL